jgi:hypothetical protein
MGMMASLITQLRAKFQSLTPLDTSTIYWETGPDGMAAHVRDLPQAAGASKPSSGGDDSAPPEEYTGSFAVSNASMSSGTPPVWKCQVRVRPGNVAFPGIPIWSFDGKFGESDYLVLTSAGTHRIFATITFDSGMTSISGGVSSVVDADFAAQSSLVDVVPLATVVVTMANERLGVTDITQHHYGDYGADTRLW